MRVLLLVTIAATCWLLSWSQTPEPELKLDDIAKKCLAKENVPLNVFTDFILGKTEVADAAMSVKCFIRCRMETEGYMKDGTILEANVVKAAENITDITVLRKIINDCKILKVPDNCQTSFNYWVCIHTELNM